MGKTVIESLSVSYEYLKKVSFPSWIALKCLFRIHFVDLTTYSGLQKTNDGGVQYFFFEAGFHCFQQLVKLYGQKMTGKLWAKIVFKLRFSVDNLYDNIFLAVQVAIDWWISIILSTRQTPRGIVVANSFSMYQSNRIKKMC